MIHLRLQKIIDVGVCANGCTQERDAIILNVDFLNVDLGVQIRRNSMSDVLPHQDVRFAGYISDVDLQ